MLSINLYTVILLDHIKLVKSCENLVMWEIFIPKVVNGKIQLLSTFKQCWVY